MSLMTRTLWLMVSCEVVYRMVDVSDCCVRMWLAHLSFYLSARLLFSYQSDDPSHA